MIDLYMVMKNSKRIHLSIHLVIIDIKKDCFNALLYLDPFHSGGFGTDPDVNVWSVIQNEYIALVQWGKVHFNLVRPKKRIKYIFSQSIN